MERSVSVNVVALVPAAGRGVRLGAGIPKALVPVRGESLLRRSVRGLLDSDVVGRVVVAAPPDGVSTMRDELADFGDVVEVVAGGDERTRSVRLALAAVEHAESEVDVVLVHDAARAFTPAAVIRDVVGAVREGAPAVIPVLAVPDTIKRVDADGQVDSTVDRSVLRAVQTPQGFRPDVLRAAYDEAAEDIATDDAGLVERLGLPVATVPGDTYAVKITTAFDLAVAEAVLCSPPDEAVQEPSVHKPGEQA